MAGKNTPEAAARNDPPSDDEDVAKLRLELRHCSLEELEEAGLVQWDRDECVVKKGPKFDERHSVQ